MRMRLCLAGMTFMALAGTGWAFEKIALIDTFDFATICDIERTNGCDFILNHVERTGANVMAWRQQTGGRPRYRSELERHPLAEMPFSKLRIPESRPGYGWLNLDRGDVDLLSYPYRQTAAHGELPAVHLTAEESHYYSFTFSTWVLEHPEYWCVQSDGTPCPCHAAFSFREEVEHRVRLLDEILARGAKLVFMDTARMSAYGPRFEYTKPSVAKWRETYGCEPPKDWKDPRWVKHVGQYLERFVKAMARRCRQKGVRLIFGTRCVGLDYDETIDRFGLDWPRLCAEGELDGVVFPYVDFRKGQEGVDPWTATDRVYAKVAALKGKADLYFSVNAYPGLCKSSFGDYAAETGLSKGACAQKLIDLAKKHEAKGVVLEVVDYRNYPDDVCQVLREAK